MKISIKFAQNFCNLFFREPFFFVLKLKVWTNFRGPGAEPPPWTLENFRKFSKRFLKKIATMHYFSIFFKKFNKACVNFLRVWTKNTICWKFWETQFWEIIKDFWWKFYRKMEFLIIFGKFLTKNRAFGNNAIFLQHFSVSGGGGSPLSPWLLPWQNFKIQAMPKFKFSICLFQ